VFIFASACTNTLKPGQVHCSNHNLQPLQKTPTASTQTFASLAIQEGSGPWFSESVAQQIKETDNTDLH
jgi:hypothetical protein